MTVVMFILALIIGAIFVIALLTMSKKQANQNNQSPIEGEYYAPPTNTMGRTKPFRMVVVDVFHIAGCGTVATGQVEQGIIRTNDAVTLTRSGQSPRTITIQEIEKFHKKHPQAEAGEMVGLVVDDRDIQSGDILSS